MANNRAPARAGDALESIDTPALLLQIEPFQTNLAGMARTVAAAGRALRPHGKAHKCVEIARRQVAAGAIGICCQKVAEAEVFVEAGIGDVLVSNQVVGERKVDRLAALAARARIAVCVDHPLQVEQLAAAARRRNVSIDVLIEVDVGSRRCGVTSIDESLALAARIAAAAPALRLRGLQAYHGRAQHLRGVDERRAAIAAAAKLAGEHRAALRAAGHSCEVVTGGGTGSFTNELASDVYTEVQPGSYVLMDTDYHANTADPLAPAFGQVLTVLTTVISAHATHVVLDAGLKALSAECGLPQSTEPGWKTSGISDEHVVMRPDGDGGRRLSVGDRFRLMPSHCDPTVNLHDWIVVMRGDTVDSVWPVDARGAMS